MSKPYSITVNMPDDEETTSYEGLHWDSSGNIEEDLTFFKRLYPRWTSMVVIITNPEAKQ